MCSAYQAVQQMQHQEVVGGSLSRCYRRSLELNRGVSAPICGGDAGKQEQSSHLSKVGLYLKAPQLLLCFGFQKGHLSLFLFLSLSLSL